MANSPQLETMDIENNIFNYSTLLRQVKKRVALAQQRAIYAANEELLRMYWDLGQMLYTAQKAEGWGKGTLVRLSQDMKNEYPREKGFSVRNFQFMMQFFEEYNQDLTMVKVIAKPTVAQLQENSFLTDQPHNNTITKPAVSQLPKYNFTLPIRHIHWTHNVILMQRVKDVKARYWYMVQCLTSHWSKDYLAEAIKLDLYGKHGALANNFDMTLPAPEAKGVKSLLKDPYIFDMLTFTDEYNERDVEIGLVKHVEQFLVEMGAGFGFMGRQYHISVSGDDYKTKDKIKAEYALRDIQKPIGISDYELGQALPHDLRSSLPSIEEIEAEFDETI